MKNSIKIYTNLVHKNFLIKLFSNIKLDFSKIEDVLSKNLEDEIKLFKKLSVSKNISGLVISRT